VVTAWIADTVHQGLISYACKNEDVVAGMTLTTTAVYEYTVTHFMDPEYILTIPKYVPHYMSRCVSVLIGYRTSAVRNLLCDIGLL
jgi:hypothetical protein